ncbi:MAG: hypothetical protein IH934_03800 [Nanoarchaeota archaeon]|nr:hypothetical protein [Nanoarchaeota archaeon]
MINKKPMDIQHNLMQYFFDLGYSVEEVPYKDGDNTFGLKIKKPIGTLSGLEAKVQLNPEPEDVEKSPIGNPYVSELTIYGYEDGAVYSHNGNGRLHNEEESVFETKHRDFDAQRITLLYTFFQIDPMDPTRVVVDKLTENPVAKQMYDDVQKVTLSLNQ